MTVAAMTVPQYLDPLPDDIWLLVLCDLAAAVSTTKLLATRLACKKFATIIASEPVAYHAVIAANRSIMRDAHGHHPRRADLPFSWWALVKDQARLDRIWIKGTRMPLIPRTHFVKTPLDEKARVDPSALLQSDWASQQHGGDSVGAGYDVTLLDYGSLPRATTAGGDELMFFKSACADIDPLTGQGLIAHLAFRRRKTPTVDYSIAVHFIKYPELAQLATHTLRHPGFGSNTAGPDDLPMTGFGGEPLDVGRGLHATLLRVDRMRQTYLLAYSDVEDRSVLVLRSLAGKSMASFAFQGPSRGLTVRASPDDTQIILLHSDSISPHIHIHTLDAVSLSPVSHATIPGHMDDLNHLSSFHPELAQANPGITIVATQQGDVALWNRRRGKLIDWISALPEDSHHQFAFLRPIYRPGLLRESPPKPARPHLPANHSPQLPPMHNQRKWMQVLCGRVDIPFGLYEYQHLRGTQMTLLGLSAHGPPEMVDPDTPVEPRRGQVLSEILGPSYMAGEVVGHLLFVLQNDGVVSVVDLRCAGREGVAPRGFLFNLHPTAVQAAAEVGRWTKSMYTGGDEQYPMRTCVLTGDQAKAWADAAHQSAANMFDLDSDSDSVAGLAAQGGAGENGAGSEAAAGLDAVPPTQQPHATLTPEAMLQAAMAAHEHAELNADGDWDGQEGGDGDLDLGDGEWDQEDDGDWNEEENEGNGWDEEDEDEEGQVDPPGLDTARARVRGGRLAATDLVVLGERGDAFLVLCGQHVAIFRRRGCWP